jgi:hypothetical protein
MRESIRRRRVLAVAALAALCLAVPASAQTFFQVSPTGSFYRTSSETPSAPRIIDLAGFLGATSLALKPEGQLQVAGPWSPMHDAVFCAAFSSTNTLLASSEQQRVPGAVISTASSSSPCVTGNTFYGGAATNITQDFFIPFAGLEVAVPTGANFLFVSVFDDYYSDNTSPDPSKYGLMVTSTVPEPSTALLLATGLVVVVATNARRRTGRRGEHEPSQS